MATAIMVYLFLGVIILMIRSGKIIKRLNEKQERDQAKSFDKALAARKVALTILFWPYYAWKIVKEDEHHDY